MDKRSFLIGGAAVVVLAGAGALWMYRDSWKSKSPQSRIPDGPIDLMTPGPLGEQALGKPDAPVTIIEYASMTCPHCASFHATTYLELKKRYIDTGQVRFIFREFPLDSVAATAFMIARCASPDKYFAIIEALFQQQSTWAVGPPASPLPPLLAIAKQAGLTEETFNACLKDQKVLDGIKWVADRGAALGVQSTPSFFINGKLQAGGMSIELLDKVLAPLLKS